MKRIDTKPTMDELLIKRFQFGVNIGRAQGDLEPTYPINEVMDFPTAKAALTAYIDDIVESVVGEDELSASIPLGMSETQHLVHRTRDSFRADQRTRYQTIKQERGL